MARSRSLLLSVVLVGCGSPAPSPEENDAGGPEARFEIINVVGTLSGTSTSVETATWTESSDLITNTVLDGRSGSLRVSPTHGGLPIRFEARIDVDLGGASATSKMDTNLTHCASPSAGVHALTLPLAAEVPGWNADTEVRLRVLSLPVMFAACNHATFSNNTGEKIFVSVPLSRFRGSSAFGIPIRGSATLVSHDGRTTEKKSWDLMMIVAPGR